MPVRPTESKIPDGLQASDLGQAVENGNLKLIAFLTEPLHYKEDKKPLSNTFVVFDTNEPANRTEPANYRWNFEFFIDGEESVKIENLKGIEGGAIFKLNSQDRNFEDKLEEKKVTEIKTTVSVDGDVANNLEMSQTVDALNEEIEDLINNPSNDLGAIAGEPDTTRIIANDYKNYLIELGNEKGEAELEKVSLNLLGALLYQAIENDTSFLSQISEFFFDPDEDDWKNYANNNGRVEYPDLIGSTIGICNIRPHVFLYLSKPPPGDNIPFKNYIIDDAKKVLGDSVHKNQDQFEYTALEELDVNNNNKIDLVNTFRFPKSCLYVVWAFLKNTKERHHDYLANILDKTNHPVNRECISTIITEFETVPQKDLVDVSSTAVQAYDIMHSRWMQAILETSILPMEIVRIKVLDIRSGQPIQDARVKRLMIKSNNKTIEYNFEANNGNHDWREDVQGNTVQDEYQYALVYLGYNAAAIPGQYFDNLKTQYRQFWDDRIIGYSFEIPAASNHPLASMQKEIIKEYKLHSRTDDNGILNVRIHKSLLENRKVSIFVGFMDFPIACEELLDDDRDYPICRDTKEEAATGFNMEWIGGDGSEQRLGWTDYINSNQLVQTTSYGWNLVKVDCRSKINMVQQLKVKDDIGSFDQFNSDLLSKFYDVDTYPIHYVVLGMVWCQPVYDEYEDAPNPAAGAITEHTYIQDTQFHNLHMHLVTIPYKMSGTDLYGGKGYGKGEDRAPARWRPDKVDSPDHWGIDIHTRIGDLVFAVHKGSVSAIDSPNAGDWVGHRSVSIEWPPIPGAVRNRCAYKHLHSHNMNVGDIVLAGQVLGQAGRSGNLDMYSYQPTHVHLDTGITPPEVIQLRSTPDRENQIMIPFNEYPLLLPCSCQVTEAMGTDEASVTALIQTASGRAQLASFPPDPRPTGQSYAYIDCRFHDNSDVVNRCWAATELKCPYIIRNNKDIIKLQVQLRHLKQRAPGVPGGFTDDINNNPQYLDPGVIDGDMKNIVRGGEVSLVAGNILQVHKLNPTDTTWDDGDYRRVQTGKTIGWVLRADLGTWDPATEQYTLVSPLQWLLPGGEDCREFSKTRNAIYQFRQITINDDGNNLVKSNNERNWENFQAGEEDDEFWFYLNQAAHITAPIT